MQNNSLVIILDRLTLTVLFEKW